MAHILKKSAHTHTHTHTHTERERERERANKEVIYFMYKIINHVTFGFFDNCFKISKF